VDQGRKTVGKNFVEGRAIISAVGAADGDLDFGIESDASGVLIFKFDADAIPIDYKRVACEFDLSDIYAAEGEGRRYGRAGGCARQIELELVGRPLAAEVERVVLEACFEVLLSGLGGADQNGGEQENWRGKAKDFRKSSAVAGHCEELYAELGGSRAFFCPESGYIEAMLFRKLGPFVHRDNRPRSSTYDSICTHCFRTVSTQSGEADLAGDEKRHRCLPRDVARFDAWRDRPDTADEAPGERSDFNLVAARVGVEGLGGPLMAA
jgi:hypothetical protein